MISQITVELPCKVLVGRKFFNINLNEYRNANYQVLNKAKKEFKNRIKPQLKIVEGERFKKIKVSYMIFPNNNRRFDTMNIVSIADKFLLDVLVEMKIIEDDNYKFVEYGKIEVTKVIPDSEKTMFANLTFMQ